MQTSFHVHQLFLLDPYITQRYLCFSFWVNTVNPAFENVVASNGSKSILLYPHTKWNPSAIIPAIIKTERTTLTHIGFAQTCWLSVLPVFHFMIPSVIPKNTIHAVRNHPWYVMPVAKQNTGAATCSIVNIHSLIFKSTPLYLYESYYFLYIVLTLVSLPLKNVLEKSTTLSTLYGLQLKTSK